MSKQTAVEWLLDNLLANGLLRLTKDEHPLYKELKDHAKEMEKEQIIDAYYYDPNCDEIKDDGEQYYNENYGGDK